MCVCEPPPVRAPQGFAVSLAVSSLPESECQRSNAMSSCLPASCHSHCGLPPPAKPHFILLLSPVLHGFLPRLGSESSILMDIQVSSHRCLQSASLCHWPELRERRTWQCDQCCQNSAHHSLDTLHGQSKSSKELKRYLAQWYYYSVWQLKGHYVTWDFTHLDYYALCKSIIITVNIFPVSKVYVLVLCPSCTWLNKPVRGARE